MPHLLNALVLLSFVVLGGCAPAQPRQTVVEPQAPPVPDRYVVKPSATNFIYEPPQNPNKAASKVTIAIIRPRLEKEESGQMVQEKVLKEPENVEARLRSLENSNKLLHQEYAQLEAQESRLTLGQIVVGMAGPIIDRKNAISQQAQYQVKEDKRLRRQLAISRLQATGESEVSGRVNTMTDAFLDSSKKDLERLLLAKGLKTAGPFKDVEDMTFAEKRDATFTLVPTIKLNIDRAQPNLGGEVPSARGQVSASCEFALVLFEPLSGQKIWQKRLPIPTQTAPYAVELTDTTLTDDRAEATTKMLSSLYKNLFDTIGKHADPEEFATLSVQALELKERAAPRMK
jgi:hypothetical protein